MSFKNKASLIIAVYKRIDFLELIFLSLEKQTFRNFEIVIAEDDCSPLVSDLINRWQKKCSFAIKHISQEDTGFRKNIILNKALAATEGEYCVFIDGDCILHKDFMKEHIQLASPDRCLFGRRVMIDKTTAENVIANKDLQSLSFRKLMFTDSRHLECAIHLPFCISRKKSGLLGCNFSVLKKRLVEINGFDEDFLRPLFGEDTDIERRLSLLGLEMKCTKFRTIQYHFHHELNDRAQDWKTSSKMYQEKVKEGAIFCKNGLIKSHID